MKKSTCHERISVSFPWLREIMTKSFLAKFFVRLEGRGFDAVSYGGRDRTETDWETDRPHHCA